MLFDDHGMLPDDGPAAYVRQVTTSAGSRYGVYTSDGIQLAVFPSQDAAFFAARQYDLEPVLVH